MRNRSNSIMKVAVLLIAAALVFAVVACGAGKKDDSTPKNNNDIAGTWEQVMADGIETITLYEDGIYVSDIKLNGGSSMHKQRSFVCKDGKLTVHYPDYGTDSSYDVQVKDNQLILKNGSSTVVYNKK